jgi:predicted small metal-binding protein
VHREHDSQVGVVGVSYVYVCPAPDCEFARTAASDVALERQVARHEARAHGRKFDRARFEDELDVT